MKGEIRGLKACEHWNDEGDCALCVYRDDIGTHIIHADIDTELAYHWIIDTDGEVKKFEVSSAMTFDGTIDNE